jgi:hypothetical protein
LKRRKLNDGIEIAEGASQIGGELQNFKDLNNAEIFEIEERVYQGRVYCFLSNPWQFIDNVFILTKVCRHIKDNSSQTLRSFDNLIRSLWTFYKKPGGVDSVTIPWINWQVRKTQNAYVHH